jgi:hypothetical protein
VTRFGRIFAQWVIFYFGQWCKITEVLHVSGLSTYGAIYVLILTKNCAGLHFVRVFHKLIWSPCSCVTFNCVFLKSYHPLPRRDSISRSIAPSSYKIPLDPAARASHVQTSESVSVCRYIKRVNYRIKCLLLINLYDKTCEQDMYAIFYRYGASCQKNWCHGNSSNDYLSNDFSLNNLSPDFTTSNDNSSNNYSSNGAISQTSLITLVPTALC